MLPIVLITARTQAANFPSRAIHLVIPFPAGGSSDFFGRTLANKISGTVGQPIVVENRNGAAGVVGTVFVAGSAPDGYTLVLSSTGALAIAPAISRKPPFDPIRDLAPISLVVRVPEPIVVAPRLGVHSLTELIAFAKAHPGRLNFASTGNGSIPHLAGVLLMREADIDIIHVPYSGAAPAITDILGGHIDMLIADVTSLKSSVDAGLLTAVAVDSAQRVPSLPNVPTTVELGYPKVIADNWFGLLAAAKTPPDIVRRLNQIVSAALGDAELQAAYMRQGGLASPDTPEEFAAFIEAEARKWGPLAKEVGVQMD